MVLGNTNRQTSNSNRSYRNGQVHKQNIGTAPTQVLQLNTGGNAITETPPLTTTLYKNYNKYNITKKTNNFACRYCSVVVVMFFFLLLLNFTFIYGVNIAALSLICCALVLPFFFFFVPFPPSLSKGRLALFFFSCTGYRTNRTCCRSLRDPGGYEPRHGGCWRTRLVSQRSTKRTPRPRRRRPTKVQ